MTVKCQHCQKAVPVESTSNQAIGCPHCKKPFQPVKGVDEEFWQVPELDATQIDDESNLGQSLESPVDSEEFDVASSNDYWSQLESMDDVDQISYDEDMISHPSTSNDLSEADLLASLEADKKRLQEENLRLEESSQLIERNDAPVQDSPMPTRAKTIVSPQPAEPQVIGQIPLETAPVQAEQFPQQPLRHQVQKPPSPKRPTQPRPAAPIIPKVSDASDSYSRQPAKNTQSKDNQPFRKSLQISGALFIVVSIGFGVFFYLRSKRNEFKPVFDESNYLPSSTYLHQKADKSDEATEVAVEESADQEAESGNVNDSDEAVEKKTLFEQGLVAYQKHSIAGYKESERLFLKTYKQEKSPETLLALSQLYVMLGYRIDEPKLIERSRKFTAKFIDNGTHKGIAHQINAQADYFTGNYKMANIHIDEAIASGETSAYTYLVKGLIDWETRKNEAVLQQAYKKQPYDFLSLYFVSKHFLKTKRAQKAASIANRMIKKFPKHHEGYLFAAQAAIERKQNKSADGYLRKARAIGVNDYDVNVVAAEFYLNQKKEPLTAKILEDYLNRVTKMQRSKLQHIYTLLGKATLENNPKKSVFYFEKLVGWDKKDVTTYNYLGLAYFNQKDYAKSIKTFRKVVSMAADNLSALLNLGLSYHQAGMNKEAEKVFRKLLARDPLHTEGHYYLAEVYAAQGNINAARSLLERVLQMNPNHSRAKKRLKNISAGL